MKQVLPCWDKPLSLEDSIENLLELSLRHALAGGCVGDEIARLLRKRDFVGLINFKLEYHEDWQVGHLIHCRQALAFFSKLEDLEIGIDKEAEAWLKFEAAEAACRVTNDLFRKFASGAISFRPRDVCDLYAARRKIAEILGRCPRLGDLSFRFGPGSTTSVKKKESSPVNKMAGPLSCSTKLAHSPMLPSILREVPHWTSQHVTDYYIDDDGWLCESVSVNIQAGKLEFVPKNAKEYRSIVKPATLDSFVQQGYGRYMARRLKAFGIDVKDQSPNKHLARTASITQSHATLDLSNASDTISRELVRFLLPRDWFQALSECSDVDVRYRGKTIQLEKFSSMGNGFTFPLETLIFWSLTRAACVSGNILAFGDDILCPSRDASAVMHLLALCGFTVNTAKSYVKGPFRESCGGDYYKGFDIRPYYQKTLVSGLTAFTLHNFYVRHFDDEGASAVLRCLPPSLRLYGPDGYGDGHLLGDHPRVQRSSFCKRGFCGYIFDSFTKVPRKQFPRYAGDWISPLYHVYTRGPSPMPDVLDRIQDMAFFDQPVRFTKNGWPLWGLPGDDGYKRVSVYTFG